MVNRQISAPPGVPQTVAIADFDAPRMLVFRAFMEPTCSPSGSARAESR